MNETLTQKAVEMLRMHEAFWCTEGAEPDDVRALLDAYHAFLKEQGYVVVPVEPTKEMLEASQPAMKSANDMLAFAATHGHTLTWRDGKPPLWHAYKAMISTGSIS